MHLHLIPSPELYRRPTAQCSEGDIDLTTGLLSWWELTDHVSNYTTADQGPANIIADIDGPLYVHDTDRGGEPGAIDFDNGPNTFVRMSDPSGYYISTENPITIGLWVKLADKAATNLILSYLGAGSVPRYELAYDESVDLLAWSMRGVDATVTVHAATLGSPAIGTWYWVELTYDPATELAGIRVATTRTADLESLAIAADTAVVPGGLEESPGQLLFGRTGIAGSLVAAGITLDGFGGELAAVGFWTRALTDCEGGRLNMPTDYPFIASRISEEGNTRISEEGGTRILE